MSGPPGTRPLATQPHGAGVMRELLRDLTADSVCDARIDPGPHLRLDRSSRSLQMPPASRRLMMERCHD